MPMSDNGAFETEQPKGRRNTKQWNKWERVGSQTMRSKIKTQNADLYLKKARYYELTTSRSVGAWDFSRRTPGQALTARGDQLPSTR